MVACLLVGGVTSFASGIVKMPEPGQGGLLGTPHGTGSPAAMCGSIRMIAVIAGLVITGVNGGGSTPPAALTAGAWSTTRADTTPNMLAMRPITLFPSC